MTSIPVVSRQNQYSDIFQRLNHPHYLANILLCFPLPVILSYHVYLHSLNNGLTNNTLAAMLGGPILIAYSLFKPTYAGKLVILQTELDQEINVHCCFYLFVVFLLEMLLESACFNAQIVNFCSLFWLR